MNKEVYLSKGDIDILEAMERIDRGSRGIIYIIDENGCLVGSVSDGDIRRWIIKHNDLKANIKKVMNKNPKFLFAGNGKNANEIKAKFAIDSLPVLNKDKQIVDIIFFDKSDIIEVNKPIHDNLTAPVVIMAGGKGTRLYPYTKILPKPLIPIGDTPILERIINGFTEYGIEDFFISVNYKKEMIKLYFSEIPHRYNISYIEETVPLGTGGSLSLIRSSFNKPIIITNCDSLINTNYKELYEHHISSGNDITVVAALKSYVVPYGVLNIGKNGELINLNEKPKQTYFVNTGMYVINPEVKDFVPDQKLYHMTDLIEDVRRAGKTVGIYPISEDSFLDMGEFDEMQRMEEKLNLLSK